jgi:TP901 family phage tail tape measure protein
VADRERSLRTDLLGRDVSLGRTLKGGARDVDQFGRRTGRSFERAGAESGRRYGMRLSKSLGGGITASTGIVSRGARLMSGALAGIGVAAVAADSIKMAATFDKTMRQTAAVAKVPQRSIRELRDVALDMGAKTSFSARQAGEAMLALGKGGLTFAQMKAGALSSTMTLAAAGGIELGEAAEYVVKGLTTFGLKADKAATIAAALAGGANASTASVEDMGLALQQAGQGAHNAGLSIQETTAVLAAFADNGLRGSDAGTSLKTMLARLVPQTDKQSNAMRRLGLDFIDAHGAILPVSAIAQQLQDRLGGLSQAQRIAAMNTVFGSDATRAATILMREGSAGLAKYIKATSDRAAAEKLAKTNTEGAAGAFERLSGAIETVQIRAGDVLLPVLADAATVIADKILPAVSKWVGAFRDDLLPHLGRMKDAWDANKGALGAFATSLTSSQGSLTSTGDKAKTLADSVVAISNAAGDASRFLVNLGHGLDLVADGATNAESSTGKFHQNVVRPFGEFVAKSALGQGTLRLFNLIAKDTVADLGDLGVKFGGASAATGIAIDYADRHTRALIAEKQAVDALKGALEGEKTAELDVRQAKVNVAQAQSRLTELVKGGRKGSLEYKQAQIDLERAQIDLKNKTLDYKTAQQKAATATSGAMHAAQNAQEPVFKYGKKAQEAGRRALVMGQQAREGIRMIPSKTVKVSATFGVNGLQIKGGSLHDIVGATGGYVTPTAIVPRQLHRGGFLQGPGTETSDSIPARLSKGEYVVRAKAVKAVGRDTLDDINAQGFAAGGPVLDARFPSGRILARAAGRFEKLIDRSLLRLVGRFERVAKELGAGKPAIAQFIRSTDPLNYHWGGAGPNVYDCSGIVGAVHLGHLGRPYGHGQRIYTTATIRAGTLGLKPGLGGVLDIGVTPTKGHMVGRYGGKNGLGFEAESARTGIKIGAAASRPESFARHYHLAKGGPVEALDKLERLALAGADIGGDAGRLRINGKTFDRGGFLPTGTSLATNNTGKAEAIMPLEQLEKAYRQSLRSEVRPPLTKINTQLHVWLRQISLKLTVLGNLLRERDRGIGGTGKAPGIASTSRAVSTRSKTLTAAQLNALPDASRYAYGRSHPLPRPPRGYVWAEDYSLVRTGFFDSGGLLMPGTTVAHNRTGKPERVLPPGPVVDERRLAKLIAEELAAALRANPAPVYMDRQKVAAAVATGNQWNARR